MNIAILTAGGVGSRTHQDIPKQFIHLGTFQISDLTYNTLGGAVGGVIYYLGYSRRRKK